MPMLATFGAGSARAFGFGVGGGNPFMEATGGTITTDGDYKVHTFTSSGTFTVTKAGATGEVEYLVIAGGGGGGAAGGAAAAGLVGIVLPL
jgi:hypothetical protein